MHDKCAMDLSDRVWSCLPSGHQTSSFGAGEKSRGPLPPFDPLQAEIPMPRRQMCRIFRAGTNHLAWFPPAAAAPLATGREAGPAQEFGSEAPHFKALGVLLPIGNRKVETGQEAEVLDCAMTADNLLLTINLLNAPESPEPSGDLSGFIWGASPPCSIPSAPAGRPAFCCGFFRYSCSP